MILFSHRLKLEEDFLNWCYEHKTAVLPNTMIAWLQAKKLLDLRNVEIYLGLVTLCPRCGGTLSTVREHNGRKYRHCYACRSEVFYDEQPGI